jgi:hypothetical protein
VHADRDQANTGPGVEPAVQETQLGRLRWELEEAERSREKNAPRVPRPAHSMT